MKGVSSTSPTVGVVAAVAAALFVNAAIAHGAWRHEFTLLQAQVAAHCLANFLLAASRGHQVASQISSTVDLFNRCRQDQHCGACWNASLWDPRETKHCEGLCTNLSGCTLACHHLSSLYRAAQQSLQMNPPVKLNLPPPPIVLVRDGQLIFDGIVWPRPDQPPLVLTVQARYDFPVGEVDAAAAESNWRNLTLLAGAPGPVRLEEPRPGHRYQFRAAAVVSDGSRGYGPASEPLILLPLRQPPTLPAPRPPAVRLNVGPSKFDEVSGWSSVVVWWSLILSGDSGVAAEFQVSWAKASTGTNRDASAVKISQTLPGTTRSYQIKHLEADALYYVEVRALTASGAEGPSSRISVSTVRQQPTVAWPRSGRVRGNGGDDCPPRSGDINNELVWPTTSFSVSGSEDSDQEVVGERGKRAHIVATVGLKAHRSLEAAGSSSTVVLLEWRRRVCIGARSAADGGAGTLTSGAVLTTAGELRNAAVRINGLEFNCHYWARLTPLSSAVDRGRNPSAGSTAQTSIETEWCFVTPADCGGQYGNGCGRERSSRDTPESPTGLIVKPLPAASDHSDPTVGSGVGPGCQVSWQPSSSGPSVSAYRIVWGPALDQSVALDAYDGESDLTGRRLLQPRIDPEKASTRIVDNTLTRLTIRPMSRATLYIVQVRSLTFHPAGDGRRFLASPDVTQLCATDGYRRLPTDVAVFQQTEPRWKAFSGDFSEAFLSAGQGRQTGLALLNLLLILCSAVLVLCLLNDSRLF